MVQLHHHESFRSYSLKSCISAGSPMLLHLQATVFIKLGGEPPHISFSAQTPVAPQAPSAFSDTAARSGPLPGAPMNMHSQPSSSPQQLRTCPTAVPVPVDDSMVPSEAPKQGVWFDKAPFDSETGRIIDPGASSTYVPSRRTAPAQPARGVGESTEAERGV
jgi:hypothetical protein